MARFTSSKYRELVVKFGHRGRVKFKRGEVEVSGDLAERLANFAERHPDYEIEQTEADAPADKPETPKQKAVRTARDLGLDESGTQAQVEARIAEHLAAQSDPEDAQDADDADDQADDDQSDDTDEDDAAEADSSEDDEN